VFRRNSAGAAEGKAQGSQSPQGAQTAEAPEKSKAAVQAGKGRPTPKRSVAEANRYRTITGATTSGRGPAKAPDPRRKLTPDEKARARDDRNRQLQAMRKGEEWALGARDRGPAKRLVRDYVDAHRRPMEFYMYALIVLVIALFAGKSDKALGNYMQIFLLVIIAVIAVDAWLLRRSLFKVVHTQLPNESTRGLALYGIMRALQLRRFRTPAPRVKPGDAIDLSRHPDANAKRGLPPRCRAAVHVSLSGRVARSAFRVQGHRAVLLAGVVEEGDLVHPAVDKLVPVLAKPALRVALVGEDRLLQPRAVHHGAIGFLVPPGPGHQAAPPLLTCVMRG
jgi:hypothetical protein